MRHRKQQAVMENLPADVLAVIFKSLKAHELFGSSERSKLMLVSRTWRDVLRYPDFCQAISITIETTGCSKPVAQLPIALATRTQIRELQLQAPLHPITYLREIFTVYQGTLRLMPLNQLRVLRLNGIRRTSEALQILVDEGLNGSMNPKFLEELSVRPSSHTYSASRVVTASDHVTSAIMLQILAVFPNLRVLDIASPSPWRFGSSPGFSSSLEQALTSAPQLQQFTLIGKMRVGDLSAFKKMHHLTKLIIMGDWIHKEIPHVLPVFNDVVTHLVLEDYPITECSARQVSLLVSALPALQHLEITVLRRSRLARYWPGLGPIPDGDTSVIFSLQEILEAENYEKLQQLQTFLSQPALGKVAIAVEISESIIHDDRLSSQNQFGLDTHL